MARFRRRTRIRTDSRKHRLRGLKLAAVFVVVISLLIITDNRIRPIVEKATTYQASIYASQAINDAIAKRMAQGDIDYERLVKLTRNAAGDVTSIQADMIEINRIKTDITGTVLESVSQLQNQDIRIASGTLSGWHLLYGRGPDLRFIIKPAGYVKADVINAFDSTGINQTRHQILLQLSVNVTALIPGFSSTAEVATSVVLAETVIVGAVPEYFTRIETPQQDIPSLVADYGAGKNLP